MNARVSGVSQERCHNLIKVQVIKVQLVSRTMEAADMRSFREDDTDMQMTENAQEKQPSTHVLGREVCEKPL